MSPRVGGQKVVPPPKFLASGPCVSICLLFKYINIKKERVGVVGVGGGTPTRSGSFDTHGTHAKL